MNWTMEIGLKYLSAVPMFHTLHWEAKTSRDKYVCLASRLLHSMPVCKGLWLFSGLSSKDHLKQAKADAVVDTLVEVMDALGRIMFSSGTEEEKVITRGLYKHYCKTLGLILITD